MQSLEPSFHQDLNGDGVIGVPPVGHDDNADNFDHRRRPHRHSNDTDHTDATNADPDGH